MNIPFLTSFKNKVIAVAVLMALLLAPVLWQKVRTTYDHWRDSIAAAAIEKHKETITKLESEVSGKKTEIDQLQSEVKSGKAAVEQYKSQARRILKEQEVLRQQVKALDAALIAARESASHVPEDDLLPTIRRVLGRLRPSR